MSPQREAGGLDMLDRKFTRTAATLAVLGGWTQAAAASPVGDIGVRCVAQAAHDDLGRRACAAEAAIEITRGPDICSRHPAGTLAAFFTAVTTIRLAHQNICARTDAFVPVSYFQPRVW